MGDKHTLEEIRMAKVELRADLAEVVQKFIDTYGVWPEIDIRKMEVENTLKPPTLFPHVVITVEV